MGSNEKFLLDNVFIINTRLVLRQFTRTMAEPSLRWKFSHEIIFPCYEVFMDDEVSIKL